MCDAKTLNQTVRLKEKGNLDTNERGIYLNTWHRTQECKSNSSRQRGLGGMVWCGEVVWCVVSGGKVDGTGDVMRLDCMRSICIVLTPAGGSKNLSRPPSILQMSSVSESARVMSLSVLARARLSRSMRRVTGIDECERE